MNEPRFRAHWDCILLPGSVPRCEASGGQAIEPTDTLPVERGGRPVGPASNRNRRAVPRGVVAPVVIRGTATGSCTPSMVTSRSRTTRVPAPRWEDRSMTETACRRRRAEGRGRIPFEGWIRLRSLLGTRPTSRAGMRPRSCWALRVARPMPRTVWRGDRWFPPRRRTGRQASPTRGDPCPRRPLPAYPCR